MIRRRKNLVRKARGFTLIESALAVTIIGTAFVSMLSLLATGTMANIDSAELTTGVNLARNIRELTLQQKYTDLPGYNNRSYQPPKDSQGNNISSMSGWKQAITVQAVDPHSLTTNQIDSTPSAVRITVTVSHNGEKVSDLSWYCFDATP